MTITTKQGVSLIKCDKCGTTRDSIYADKYSLFTEINGEHLCLSCSESTKAN